MGRPRKDQIELSQEIKIWVTPVQRERLRRVTAYDRLSMAEHTRRALDVYLDNLESKYHIGDSPTLKNHEDQT